MLKYAMSFECDDRDRLTNRLAMVFGVCTRLKVNGRNGGL